MRGNKTFPKEGVKKEKETIRDLRAQLRNRDREIDFLRKELENLMKPVRARKPQDTKAEPSFEDLKKEFALRFKKEVLDKKE